MKIKSVVIFLIVLGLMLTGYAIGQINTIQHNPQVQRDTTSLRQVEQESILKDMVLVPSGYFVFLNSPDGYGLIVYPNNPVYLDSFYIDRTEVTNEKFSEFLNLGNDYCYNNRMKIIRDSSGVYRPADGHGDHPVVFVDYEAANAFAVWSGKRLPTEMEWEKAARGVSDEYGKVGESGAGFRYPWGDSPPDSSIANYVSGKPLGYVETTPAGFYDGTARNGFLTKDNSSIYGAYDMAGNVWEWTSSKLTPYNGETVPDDVLNLRVARGGSWKDASATLKVATRIGFEDSIRLRNLGFRCVKGVNKR